MRAEQKSKLASFGFGEIDTKWWGSVDEVPTSECTEWYIPLTKLTLSF